MPLVTALGLVGNGLSILVLHSPEIDMKVPAVLFYLDVVVNVVKCSMQYSKLHVVQRSTV